MTAFGPIDIQGGYDFLLQAASFQVSESLLPTTPDSSAIVVIAAGLLNTLSVAACAIPLASILGLLFGLLRLTPHPLLGRLSSCVTVPLRNTPVLLQLFIWYGIFLALPSVRQAWHPLPGIFLSNRGLAFPVIDSVFPLHWHLPALQGFGLRGGASLSPEWLALLCGLALYHATYIADIVHASIRGVPLSQWQAGQALGLTPMQNARWIVFPYAKRAGIPPYANQCATLLRNSSLAVAIGYPDLMGVLGSVTAQTSRALECLSIAVGLYLLLGAGIGAVAAYYNRRATITVLEDRDAQPLGAILRPDALCAPALGGSIPKLMGTAVAGLIIVAITVGLLKWAVFDAVWSGSLTQCTGEGACWIAVQDNVALLFFGTLSPAARLQAAIATGATLLAVAPMLLDIRSAGWRRMITGMAVCAAIAALSGAGIVAPLPSVRWSGVMVTIVLAVTSITASLPIALLLALARRSAIRALRWPSTLFIEGVRGIPLVTQLLLAVSLVPFVLGGDWSSRKFLLALIAITINTACMLAEVLRGGLQSVSRGQPLAARALGLSETSILLHVVLPQAIQRCAGSAIGVMVGAVKDTSLVSVIGLFDVLGTAKAVLADGTWRPYFTEIYLFVFGVYFIACLSLSFRARRLSSRRAAPDYATAVLAITTDATRLSPGPAP